MNTTIEIISTTPRAKSGTLMEVSYRNIQTGTTGVALYWANNYSLTPGHTISVLLEQKSDNKGFMNWWLSEVPRGQGPIFSTPPGGVGAQPQPQPAYAPQPQPQPNQQPAHRLTPTDCLIIAQVSFKIAATLTTTRPLEDDARLVAQQIIQLARELQ